MTEPAPRKGATGAGPTGPPRAGRAVRPVRRVGILVGPFWLVAVACALGVLLAAWVADWRLQVVESASMAPVVPKDSLAVVSPVNPRVVHEGDVISFRDPSDRTRTVLHRVTRVMDRGPSGLFFETQGDANATPDPLLVPWRDLEGRLRWHVPRLGRIAWRLRPPGGVAPLILLPAIVALVSTWAVRRRERATPEEPTSPLVEKSAGHPPPGLSSEDIARLCASGWNRYYVQLSKPARPSMDVRSRCAASWREYYVRPSLPREIDLREPMILVGAERSPANAST